MPPAPSSAAVRALVGRSRIPVLTTVREVRAWRASARDRGLEVGFVPTMGSCVASLRGLAGTGRLASSSLLAAQADHPG